MEPTKRKKLEIIGKKVDEGVQLAFQRLREKQAAEQTRQPETADAVLK